MLAVEDLLLVAAELQRLAKGFLSGDRPFECAVAGRFGGLEVVGLRHRAESASEKSSPAGAKQKLGPSSRARDAKQHGPSLHGQQLQPHQTAPRPSRHHHHLPLSHLPHLHPVRSAVASPAPAPTASFPRESLLPPPLQWPPISGTSHRAQLQDSLRCRSSPSPGSFIILPASRAPTALLEPIHS